MSQRVTHRVRFPCIKPIVGHPRVISDQTKTSLSSTIKITTQQHRHHPNLTPETVHPVSTNSLPESLPPYVHIPTPPHLHHSMYVFPPPPHPEKPKQPAPHISSPPHLNTTNPPALAFHVYICMYFHSRNSHLGTYPSYPTYSYPCSGSAFSPPWARIPLARSLLGEAGARLGISGFSW